MGVNRGGGGCEYQGRPGVLAPLQVYVEWSRVTLEILTGPKLRWVDEDGNDNESCFGAAVRNEPDMTVVQRTHRGNQTDAFADCASGGHRAPDLGDRFDQFSHATPSEPGRRGGDNRDYLSNGPKSRDR